ncbi:MAG: RsbRD N-terminal domain-containing protein [Pseudomonadota bacterium]
MKLTDLLTRKKSRIVDGWLRVIYESYAAETAIFLKKDKDRFDNPVGASISQGIKGLYDALLVEMDTDRVMAYLDEIIKIRAIQNFSPSQALAFIFLLKNVIREELAKELRAEDLSGELLELESRIDGLALLGFDVYTKRREKLHEVRVNEIKNRVSGLLRRTGLELT